MVSGSSGTRLAASAAGVRFFRSPCVFGRYGRSGPALASKTSHASAWKFDSSAFRVRCVMETVIVEIRAGEGGDDAKALVVEQFSVYARMMERRCL